MVGNEEHMYFPRGSVRGDLRALLRVMDVPGDALISMQSADCI